MIGFVEEFFMDPTVESEDSANAEPVHAVERPPASRWLWRPWYAKLWWAAIIAYWAGKVGSFYSSILDQFYTGALAGFLNVVFFPPLALMVLGLSYVRAWFEWSDWEFVEPTHEQLFPKRSVGGMRDPYADPLDPRSGAIHWRRVDGSP
jgi:hypothetical protein